MRERQVVRSHASCAAAGVTRRHFVRTAAIGLLAASRGAAGVLSLRTVVAAADPWREARAIVRGGTLGAVAWAACGYPAGDAEAATALCWTDGLQRLLAVLDVAAMPSGVTVLGHAAPTAIAELAGGALVYAAPRHGRADGPLAVIRGTCGTLLVHEHGVSVRQV